MCITISKRCKPDETVREEYRVFIKRNGKLYSIAQGKKSRDYPVGEWLHEKDYRVPGNYTKGTNGWSSCASKKMWEQADPEERYPFGFHSYVSKVSADRCADYGVRYKNECGGRKWTKKFIYRVVRKVLVRGTIATGTDKFTWDTNYEMARISEEMFILPAE